jgi:hypothetical protein
MVAGFSLGARRRALIGVGVAVFVIVGVALGVLASRPGEAHLSLTYFEVEPATWASPSPGTSLSGSDEIAAVTYVDGATVRYAFALHDDGPAPVTVTELVAPAPDFLTLLRPVAMGLAAEKRGISYGYGVSPGPALNADFNEPDVEPFHSFTLQPGADRVIYVYARMGDCEWYMPGSAETLEALTVRYTVGGDARQTQLALPEPIQVSVPLDVRCPRTRPRPAPRSGVNVAPATPLAVPPP